MIIISSANNSIPPVIGGINDYYDEFGNRYRNLTKKILINPYTNTGKLEKMDLMYTDDKSPPVLYKECGIGLVNKENTMMELDNYTYSVVHINDGSYIQSGGYLDYHRDDTDADPCIFYGHMNVLSPYKFRIDDESFKKVIITSINAATFNANTIDDEINGFEDAYQLPYTDTIGLVNSFFLTWTFAYPFECYIHIDTKRNLFNIPKIKYLHRIDKDKMKVIYADFIREVSGVCMYLSYIVNKEKQFVNFNIFYHPFGLVVNIIDNNNIILRQLYYNHNSTQIQSIMKSVRANGLKYIESDALGILSESVLYEPVDQALECCDILY